MNVEDAINELKKYPPHYKVMALLKGRIVDDKTGEFYRVENSPHEKIVYLQLVKKLTP